MSPTFGFCNNSWFSAVRPCFKASFAPASKKGIVSFGRDYGSWKHTGIKINHKFSSEVVVSYLQVIK